MSLQIQSQQATISVLVTDDSLPVLGVINSDLEWGGYQGYSATNSVEVLQQAVALQPDLILLSTHLPDINSYDLYQTLGTIKDTRHIPVVFMTACYECLDQAQVRSVRGASYLIKPFQLDDLRTCIETQVRQPYNFYQPSLTQSNPILNQA